MSIKAFLQKHYKHFNAAVVIDAAEAWIDHLKHGRKMLVTLAGAMSTAELGIILAEMIRQDKVHAISTTGANLEEDVFNLVAHEHYCRVPDYRGLSAEAEQELFDKGFNRVTDTCIPEEEAFRALQGSLLPLWQKADKAGERYFPHEYFYQLFKTGLIESKYQIDPKNSWLLAAYQKNLPIWTPGWEDSTLGNIFVSMIKRGELSNYLPIRSGVEAMGTLVDWYVETTKKTTIGFFQIGGGIAGDFPICTVPLINQDLELNVPLWSYFCQISDSTTSFGSYSGAVPNEKITWGKLSKDTPRFVIESDAAIVAPLVFQYVLES